MKNSNDKNLFALFTRFALLVMVGLCLSVSGAVVAQEAPPKEKQEEKQDEQKDKNQEDKDKDFSKKSKKDSEDNKDSDKKQEDEKSKSDAEKDDAEKDDAEKDDAEKKDDAKKDDAKKDDDKKADAKKDDDKKAESSRSSRSRRRVSRRTENTRQSASFLKVFEPVISDTVKATVKIKCKNSVVAFGAIVSSDGYVLTKHSELKRPITVQLSDGEEIPATVFGVHEDTDLALLKIEASDSKLSTVRWATDDAVDIGNWLATVSDTELPLAVGVVGVRARFIKPQSGFMGVNLGQVKKGVRISNVTPDSPAQEAGLRIGDIVIKVNGESFTDQIPLIQKIKSFPPGETVRLGVLRKDREIFMDVTLGEERTLNPQFARSNQQNTMGGNKLSSRRQNFPMAVQHDAVLKPEQCGGPVVNVDGEVVGINIARQGRVASLMLPSSLVQPIVAEMKSGKLNPVLVHQERIEEISNKLQNFSNIVNRSPVNDDDLEKEVKALAKKEKQLRKELEETLQKRIRREVEFESATKEFKSAKAEVERLTKEREALSLGAKK